MKLSVGYPGPRRRRGVDRVDGQGRPQQILAAEGIEHGGFHREVLQRLSSEILTMSYIARFCKPENKVALGFVEGLNNKIGVIQRRAYGLLDRGVSTPQRSSPACSRCEVMPKLPTRKGEEFFMLYLHAL